MKHWILACRPRLRRLRERHRADLRRRRVAHRLGHPRRGAGRRAGHRRVPRDRRQRGFFADDALTRTGFFAEHALSLPPAACGADIVQPDARDRALLLTTAIGRWASSPSPPRSTPSLPAAPPRGRAHHPLRYLGVSRARVGVRRLSAPTTASASIAAGLTPRVALHDVAPQRPRASHSPRRAPRSRARSTSRSPRPAPLSTRSRVSPAHRVVLVTGGSPVTTSPTLTASSASAPRSPAGRGALGHRDGPATTYRRPAALGCPARALRLR